METCVGNPPYRKAVDPRRLLLSGKLRKILPTVFAEPMSHAQLVSLRNAFGTPEALADSMVYSRLTTSYEEALRTARMVFCAPPEPKTTRKPNTEAPANAPAADAEPAAPKADSRHIFNRKDLTPRQVTESILAFAEQLKQGPEKGWLAAKNLVELAVFDKQFGLQAQIALERIVNGTDLAAQRALMALGSYPHSAEVDQMALQTLLARPKFRPALEKWSHTVGHPLRQNASNFLTFMGKKAGT
jgi:hypothetical protein